MIKGKKLKREYFFIYPGKANEEARSYMDRVRKDYLKSAQNV